MGIRYIVIFGIKYHNQNLYGDISQYIDKYNLLLLSDIAIYLGKKQFYETY